MQIAYLNKGGVKKQSETEMILQEWDERSINLTYNLKKAELDKLGITNEEFVRRAKEYLQNKRG